MQLNPGIANIVVIIINTVIRSVVRPLAPFFIFLFSDKTDTVTQEA